MASLVERYAANISGVLSCLDRVVIYGTLPEICYAGGMTSYLYKHGIRIFDYTKFAEPLKNMIRENAEKQAFETVLKSSSSKSRNPFARNSG